MRRRDPRGAPAARLRGVVFLEDAVEDACRLHARAVATREAGQPHEGRRLARRAVTRMRSAVGNAHPDVANLLIEVARVERELGHWRHAESAAREACHVLRPFARVRMPEVVRLRAQSMTVLAAILVARGAWPEARRLYGRASVVAARLGANDLDLAAALNDRAVLHKLEGRHVDAARLYRRVAAIVRRRGSPPAMRATLLHNLAGLDHDRGRFATAARLAREGLALRRRIVGPRHRAYAADLAAYAAILDGLGKHAEARRANTRALKVFERTLGSDDYEVGMVLHNLGAACQALGQRGAARRHYTRSLTIKRRVLGARHPNVALTLHALGNLDASPAPASAEG
jgi:tetratricopeptide (TPR) repeat protein